MKKLSFIMMCLMASLFATAQTIEKTYYFGQPNVSQIQGYEQIQFDNCMQSAIAGQPSLPWQSISLMLPQGQEAVAIEVELSDFQTIAGSHNLFPYQSARTYSDPVRRQFEKDEALYASKSVYPAQAYGKLSTQYLNGVGFAFSTANMRAMAVMVFSPPDSRFMFCSFFPGGCASISMADSRGLFGSSSVSLA